MRRFVQMTFRFSAVKFQSTHPRGMRLAFAESSEPVFRFQSTHPRGMRHSLHRLSTTTFDFNPRIHEGCDFWCHSVLHPVLISIHASTRDATVFSFACLFYEIISIHASTRDATSPISVKHPEEQISIHASTRDATVIDVFSCVLMQFQSTHPRGMRRHRSVCQCHLMYFNPRIHEGCDSLPDDVPVSAAISIHASTRDAT